LPGDSVTILVAAESDVAHRSARMPRELCSHPARIRAALFDDEQGMGARTVRFEAEHFLDEEILRLGANAASRRRHTVCARDRQRRREHRQVQ